MAKFFAYNETGRLDSPAPGGVGSNAVLPRTGAWTQRVTPSFVTIMDGGCGGFLKVFAVFFTLDTQPPPSALMVTVTAWRQAGIYSAVARLRQLHVIFSFFWFFWRAVCIN